MRKILLKYKFLFLYGIFGLLTVLINIVTYHIFYNYLGCPNVPSNVIAWVLAVLFAFITNKLYVFESKSMARKTFFRELVKFLCARLSTGGLDLAIMFIGVDLLQGPAIPYKIASNIIVVILNFVLSKLVVFKK